ncbi:MAG: HNH endonuclease [Alphaproteobacteria bacterium]|nr:HNH endonuclease [Alphaproteobacteria bacterium]MBO4643909.1 HNH endonuclease [Alphaproteobacteria bacterium]
MLPEERMVHTKRERKKGKGKKGNKNHQSSQAVAKQPKEFSFDTIHGLKLTEVEYKIPSSAERKAKRAEFQGSEGQEGVRSKFLKMLAKEHAQELKDKLGMTDADIARMAEGKSVNGYNVHHKLPIHGGGKNEFSNFILTPLYPHDQWHHDVLDKQIQGMNEGDSRTVLLPYSDEMIYDPKKFGYTKENQPVKPNYSSRVNPNNYPQIYKPEHVADAAKRKSELNKFAPAPKNDDKGGKKFSMAEIAKRKGAER